MNFFKQHVDVVVVVLVQFVFLMLLLLWFLKLFLLWLWLWLLMLLFMFSFNLDAYLSFDAVRFVTSVVDKLMGRSNARLRANNGTNSTPLLSGILMLTPTPPTPLPPPPPPPPQLPPTTVALLSVVVSIVLLCLSKRGQIFDFCSLFTLAFGFCIGLRALEFNAIAGHVQVHMSQHLVGLREARDLRNVGFSAGVTGLS